ncbi:MAG: Gfo/Idh/MocA family oxidoreductase [Bryobacterales bacterium]|nr:Gfo/Idh/MocA family oxidoreductase [Bryobacterales bacterium]
MDKKLGIAILGAGDVAGGHISAYRRNPFAEVRAILSRDAARASAKARQFGLEHCRSYTSLDALLKADDIDAVSICTPNHLHAEQGAACAQAGKHVFVEKPVALDLAGLRKLDAAVRQYGVRSITGFVLRWNPLFETIRAILADGLIGKLFHAEVDYLHGITSDLALFPWVSKRAYGGTALLAAGCHAVDAVRWFTGKEAVEVFSFANFSQGNPLGYEYEPNSVTLIRFEDGTTGKVATSIEYVAPYTFPIVLMGNGGTIRDNRLYTSRWPGQTGWAAIPTILPDSGAVTHHPFNAEMDHFIDCILTGRESHCNVADAVKTHEICLAAEQSRLTGLPVRLPLQ